MITAAGLAEASGYKRRVVAVDGVEVIGFIVKPEGAR